MSNPFCLECSCSGKPIDLGNGKIHQEKNWDCPLLGGTICETCCQVKLAGGMGASDTLEGMVRKTGKSATEVHAICVACPHGGPDLDEPPRLTVACAESGEMVTSGPEFEEAEREFREYWALRFTRLFGSSKR
jgi:hypothetical protein